MTIHCIVVENTAKTTAASYSTDIESCAAMKRSCKTKHVQLWQTVLKFSHKSVIKTDIKTGGREERGRDGRGYRRARLGMHGKAEKIGVDPMNISPDNP